MNVKRTEQVWISPNKNLSRLCHLSKNLYNQGNYIIKQMLKDEEELVYDVDKVLNGHGSDPSENYKELPSQTAQWTLKLLDKDWFSFFRCMKEWKKHPEKFKVKPGSPKYKKKNGEHILIFTNQQCKIRDGILKFPKKASLEVKTRLPDDTNLREVRIKPRGVGYVCEIVYEKEVTPKKLDKNRVVGIDFGVKNIITMVNNIGLKPIIVKDDGKGIKSINQFYEKRKAKIRSVYDKQKIKDGDKMRRLKVKRGKKTHDYVHNLSRFIVDWCAEHNVGTIIFGYNSGWKYGAELGKKINQTFIHIPYLDIIKKTEYKAEEIGIEVKKQEESHTSKCSFFDNESIEHHEEYIGKRTSRGLFRTSNGIIVNADVNAGYNIVKKAIPKAFGKLDAGRIGGHGLCPMRYSLESCKEVNICC